MTEPEGWTAAQYVARAQEAVAARCFDLAEDYARFGRSRLSVGASGRTAVLVKLDDEVMWCEASPAVFAAKGAMARALVASAVTYSVEFDGVVRATLVERRAYGGSEVEALEALLDLLLALTESTDAAG